MKKIRKLLLVFLSLNAFLVYSTPALEPTVYELIIQRVQNTEWGNVSNVTILDDEVTNLVSTIKIDGSWDDIDYLSTAQTNWAPTKHLDRLKKLVMAYTLSSSSHYGNSELYSNISNALDYWYTADPRSTNWWMQKIGCPQRMGVILILMRSGDQQLSATLENNLISRMEAIGGSPDAGGSQGTGANKVDIATHWVYRGCLKQSETVLSFGVEQVYYPVFATTGEGIQHDFSYFQHGQQFMTGAYGSSFITGIAKVANFTLGTIYALSAEKLDLLTNFGRDAYLQLVRGKYFLYNSVGRGLSRPNSLNASSVIAVSKLLKNLDLAKIDVYNAAEKRINEEESASYGMKTKQTHYWRADYSLYLSPSYNFDVRMASNRTYRNENGNNENLKGYFLSEGAHTIAVDGDEYFNIFPVWDWTKIPGITAPQKSSIPIPSAWGTYGTSTFAGGVSNDSVGITAFGLDNKEFSINTTAKKSWFMFGNEVVCLGAGIKSTASEEINTTINQCLLDGDITISSAGSEKLFVDASDNQISDVDWVYHDKVGYFFPNTGNLNISKSSQSGSWYSINRAYSTDIVTNDVFKLWLNHGKQPTDASYAYVIVPGKTLEEIKNYKLDDIEILVNSDSAQVVYHKSQDVWGFVFYRAASFSNDQFTVKADGSCSMLMKNPESAKVEGWLSDPSQSKLDITIRFTSSLFPTEKGLITELPKSPYAGSTVEFKIDENTPDYLEPIIDYVKVYPTDDTYVRNGNYASTNYGSESTFVVKNDGVGYARQSFLKFNLNEIDPELITEAKLVLSVKGANTDITTTTWQLYYVSDDAWTESQLTWNNKPNAAASVMASHKASVSGSEVEFDLTDTIKSEAGKANENLSFQLVSTVLGSKTDASFYSKEHTSSLQWPCLKIHLKQNSTNIDKVYSFSETELRLYPNIIREGQSSWLKIYAQKSSKTLVSIRDLNGRKISALSFNNNHGDNTIQMDTSSITKGLYLVSVTDEDLNSLGVQKLIIQ